MNAYVWFFVEWVLALFLLLAMAIFPILLICGGLESIVNLMAFLIGMCIDELLDHYAVHFMALLAIILFFLCLGEVFIKIPNPISRFVIVAITVAASYMILNSRVMDALPILDNYLTRRVCETRFGKRDRYFQCVITHEMEPVDCYNRYRNYGKHLMDCEEQWHWSYGWIYLTNPEVGGLHCGASWPCFKNPRLVEDIPNPSCVIL